MISDFQLGLPVKGGVETKQCGEVEGKFFLVKMVLILSLEIS